MKNTSGAKSIPPVPVYLSWLFPYKRRSLPISTKSPIAYYLLQNKISITFVNWLFQGIRGMGTADLIGKITLDLIFIALFIMISNSNILISFVGAHTLNWIVNTHFWDFGRFLGITRTSPRRFLPYLKKVKKRVVRRECISSVIIIGSISRNQRLTSTSDIDMIFIRGAGFNNALKAVIVTMSERALAFFCKFPLHLELYDRMDCMKKHRKDEVPVLIKDDGGLVVSWYNEAGRSVAFLDDIEMGD